MLKKRISAGILSLFLLFSLPNTSVLTKSREAAPITGEQTTNPWQDAWLGFCEWIARSLHLLEEDL